MAGFRPGDPQSISFTKHAIERGIERSPDLANHPNPVNKMYREVVRAFEEGRVSKSRPRFIAYGRRKLKEERGGTYRFVWNEEETRAYVVRKLSDRWVVRTVMQPATY